MVQQVIRVADPEVGVADQGSGDLAGRRLETILGAVADALFVVAPDGTITHVSRAAEPIASTLPELTASALFERIQPAGLDIASLAAGEPRRVRLAEGVPRWFEVSARTVEDGVVGGPTETILVFHDVTAAQRRDAAGDPFIGVLSHELRTPLTTIYGGATVLARSPVALDGVARAGIIDDIRGEAERLRRLVDNLITLTRVGEEELVAGTDPVLVQRVIPAVLATEAARWPGGHLESDIQPRLPPVVGDEPYVEQVLRNLLINARTYGGPGRVRVEASAIDGDEIVIRVLDVGPGIVEAEAGRLFDLYYRSPSVTKAVSGSGIGLFVCARLVAAMGGRVWAANRPTGGAEFGFSLRILAAEE